jgi:hypothetical protein
MTTKSSVIEDKELAIIKAFNNWRAYLEGNPNLVFLLVRVGAGVSLADMPQSGAGARI